MSSMRDVNPRTPHIAALLTKVIAATGAKRLERTAPSKWKCVISCQNILQRLR
ncbi:hypothetical protein BCR43DRAFT_487171 [Syncephalastrum racemosum]|uniref:Uncharacterized protein n=1 Tax=Syncephalastrum racemosum TaxID=13706 RepID=A0A1X2HQG0_SYNRA|nr:hypothetical protein BCR43DRAFT_487171 [Syncephalastrum racemosum]